MPRSGAERAQWPSDDAWDASADGSTSSARPRTRGDCESAPRPCPFVSCRYHLYLDVTSVGSIRLNFPGLELDQLPDTCALDVADRGGGSLAYVADRMNLVRERVHQIEQESIVKLRRRQTLRLVPRAAAAHPLRPAVRASARHLRVVP